MVTFVLLLPLIITVLTSFKPAGEVITAVPTLIPHRFSLQNYIDLFTIQEFPRYLLNSSLVASCTAVLTLIIASLAACALVWMRFPGKKVILCSILFTYMFPHILLLIPLFLMCHNFNLIDTKFSLVLVYLAFSLPFSTWMLQGFFESIPRELIEASFMDGCSYRDTLLRIVIPVSLPGVGAVGIFSFVLAWGEYLFAGTLINHETNRTIAIGLQTLVGYYRTDYALLTAASTAMSLPIFVLLVAAQKYFIQGLTTGSINE
ncbi:MAG: carbohydrate ABC transporter permease [Eubacteriales bacterium]|jgi:ABC-type glycerol-3-phosphate transport system permease component